MRSAVVFDLDGTLSDDAHRKLLVKGESKFYPMYYSLMAFDKPKMGVIRLLHMCQKQGMAIIILTARPEKYREETVTWLDKYSITYDLLEMRCDSDFRKAHIVKKQILDSKLRPYYKITLAFDDSANNIQMFHTIGIETVSIS